VTTVGQTLTNFRFLVRSVRWVELAITALIVFFARAVSHLDFPILPVAIVFGASFLWNLAFWYAGRRHLVEERGIEGVRLLMWSWVVADVVTNLLLITFTGGTSSPFLFFLVLPVILGSVALGRPGPSYGVAAGSVAGLAAVWAMDRAGSIPRFRSYPAGSDSMFYQPDIAAGIFLMSVAVLSLLVYTIFRFRPNFFIFQEAFREGRFRIHSFRAGDIQELRLEEVEAIGPEDLLEEVVQNLTTNPSVVFSAAMVFPAGDDTIGGVPGNSWHQGLTRQRIVSVTRRQVIPTWSEFRSERSELFRHLRYAETGDLWEGPFAVLRKDGLFPHFEDAENYLATPVAQDGRTVVVLIVGVRNPVRDRSEVVLHLLNVAAQLKPLMVAETRLSQMRGELSALHDQNESLSRVNRLQSDFVSIASHELKTPLTSIMAYTDALLMHADDPAFGERKEFLRVVRDETDRLLRMVNRILDFSAIEFGQRNLKRTRIEMRTLVEDCVTTMRHDLDRRQVRVELNLPVALPRVEVDPDLMKQVLLNLLNNAWKFSPQGGCITVAAREAASAIEVVVSDQGPGIPEDEVENIFKQFYRVHRDGADTPEGSGLGLTIVRNIVELHGGRITVDGGVGRGATFTFTIPKEQCINDRPETVLGDLVHRPEFTHLMKLLVRMVADYMDCKIVSVMLLSADRKQLFVQVAYGLEEEIVRDARVPVGEGIAGRVVASGRPMLIENVEDIDGFSGPNNPQYETSSLISVPLMMNDQVVGAVNCNNKVTGEPFYAEDLSLLVTLTEKVTLALARALEFEDSRDTLQRTVRALQALVDLHGTETRATKRAVRYAMELGRRMGLTRHQILALQYAVVIHDVGMTRQRRDLLRRRGPLDPGEVQEVRRHPGEGAELVEPFLSADELEEAIRYHHERMDGTGYPHGLSGEHIPLVARIVSVVDAYDSMTSPRPYRRTLRPSEAGSELVENAGSQFDPDVVRAFLDILAENGELSREDYMHLKEGERWLRPASLS
jgi:signal transduction histidine kinase/HD-GYP domain-containing protein (c-di-GMP phosphodiesterase class II)